MELTPDFWKDYVRKRKAEFSTKRVANKKMWEEMAHYYKDFEKESSYSEMKKIPIEFLKEKGVLNKDTTVADIGCGPGTHAIELAKHSKKVLALDIANDMLKTLEEKMKKNNINNISFKCSDFFKEDFKEQFDLVFVSMSPILNELETVDKLLSISKRYMFLTFWAGKRENKVFNQCYETIFKKKFKWDILDITITFNYLYSLGFTPSIFYRNITWENKFDFEKIFQHVLWHLKFYKDDFTENEKETIKNILLKEKQWQTELSVGFLFLDKMGKK